MFCGLLTCVAAKTIGAPAFGWAPEPLHYSIRREKRPLPARIGLAGLSPFGAPKHRYAVNQKGDRFT